MTAAWCRHHPDQAARGVCVRCAAPLCAACITKIDGVNHCQSCLAQLAAEELAQASEAPGPGSRTARWLGIALGGTVLSALCWLMLDTLFRSAP